MRSIAIFILVLTVGPHSANAQATWKFVDTPFDCEFYECVVYENGKSILLSDSCGVFGLDVELGEFRQMIEPMETNSTRFVPRSIVTNANATLFIAGHSIHDDSVVNRSMIPRLYTSLDSGFSWNICVGDYYGKYQQLRLLNNDTVVLIYERRTPSNSNSILPDSVSLTFLKSFRETEIGSVVLRKIVTGFSGCTQNDYYTTRLTTDGQSGVAIKAVGPCDDGPQDEPHYSFRGWNSTDGGKTFPQSWGPDSPSDYMWGRPYRFLGPLYLAPDYWINGLAISRDQGKSWKVERIPISDRADSVTVARTDPALFSNRKAVGRYIQEYLPGNKPVYVFGTFDIDNGTFQVEHKDTLDLIDPSPVYASKAGHAVITFGKHGMYVRTPDPLSSVSLDPTKKLQLYPNPSHDVVRVLGVSLDDVIEVISVDGNMVKIINVESETVSIDLNELSTGMYVVRSRKSGKTELLTVMR